MTCAGDDTADVAVAAHALDVPITAKLLLTETEDPGMCLRHRSLLATRAVRNSPDPQPPIRRDWRTRNDVLPAQRTQLSSRHGSLNSFQRRKDSTIYIPLISSASANLSPLEWLYQLQQPWHATCAKNNLVHHRMMCMYACNPCTHAVHALVCHGRSSCSCAGAAATGRHASLPPRESSSGTRTPTRCTVGAAGGECLDCAAVRTLDTALSVSHGCNTKKELDGV